MPTPPKCSTAVHQAKKPGPWERCQAERLQQGLIRGRDTKQNFVQSLVGSSGRHSYETSIEKPFDHHSRQEPVQLSLWDAPRLECSLLV